MPLPDIVGSAWRFVDEELPLRFWHGPTLTMGQIGIAQEAEMPAVSFTEHPSGWWEIHSWDGFFLGVFIPSDLGHKDPMILVRVLKTYKPELLPKTRSL